MKVLSILVGNVQKTSQYWQTAMKQINTDSLNSCQIAGGNTNVE